MNPIILSTIFLIAIGFGVVNAQEAFDLYAGNAPLILPAQNPAIVSEPIGTVISGTIRGTTQVSSCSLQNCMTENDYTGVKVQGIMPSYRAEIQTQTETIVFEPIQDAPQSPLGIPTQEWLLIVAVVALIGAILYLKSRSGGRL